jgi:hypothetical protein
LVIWDKIYTVNNGFSVDRNSVHSLYIHLTQLFFPMLGIRFKFIICCLCNTSIMFIAPLLFSLILLAISSIVLEGYLVSNGNGVIIDSIGVDLSLLMIFVGTK